MHVLFVHRTFPGQFGNIASHLAHLDGYRCTFISRDPPGSQNGIQKVQYRQGDLPAPRSFLSQDFDEGLSDAVGVYEALSDLGHSIQPDLIVGHGGWGSTLLLPELYPDVPIIDYFEYFYRTRGSAIDFRTDWPAPDEYILRHRLQNAMIMLHLEYCTAGYTPSRFQHGLLPRPYGPKVRVIHDGIDTGFWRRTVDPIRAQSDTRIVTYVARGLEAMRGFDIFMRVAKRIYEAFPNVVFLVVGWDTVEYGHDLSLIPENSFKEHVLKQDDYDLERIRFLGPLPSEDLVRILSLSDLHIYLTVPFVVSWSLLNAMSCGCTVLASNTAPVQEIVRHEQNGLLGEFFDVEGLAASALAVLRDPGRFRRLGSAAEETIRREYSLEVVMPRMTAFFHEVAARAR